MLKMANGTLALPLCLRVFPGLQFVHDDAASIRVCLLCKWTRESETNFINKKYLSTFSRSIHIMVFAYDNFVLRQKSIKGAREMEKLWENEHVKY